jgi:hypothetical protein
MQGAGLYFTPREFMMPWGTTISPGGGFFLGIYCRALQYQK